MIREYFNKLYSNKLENLQEIDKFLYAYDQTKLNQEATSQLNTFITNN
jgi:hypothetical protein